MIYTLFTTMAIMAGLLILWAGVQSLWRKSFSDYIEDEDVLAARRSCGNCGCHGICKNEN
ncbi:MAG: hypothetical protein HKN67_12945 [Saprospiraceae bacterium]|nr:hypothetical protein [Bacteroidia bacterium]NNF22844.1 hypothetical protein [Saprospiraceae bacterium]